MPDEPIPLVPYEGPPPPKGWKIKCIRAPKASESYLDHLGNVKVASHDFCDYGTLPILERIEPVRLQKWVNVNKNGWVSIFQSETDASVCRDDEDIAVAVPVTIEYYPD